MPTPLQEWLHGAQDKVSKTVIDTEKKIGPKLAGRVGNDVTETKGIIDNGLRIGATVGTAIANKIKGTNIPISHDYYDSIRWLLDGQNGELPPYLVGRDNEVPKPQTENQPQQLDTDYSKILRDSTSQELTQTQQDIVSAPQPMPPTFIDETDYSRLVNGLTKKVEGEEVDMTNYNNFIKPNFVNSMLAMIASPYTDTRFDDGGRYLKGNQLLSFNRYLAFNPVSGITPDDPQYFRDKNAKQSDGWTPIGTRSLFNNWRMVAGNQARETKFFDTPSNRKKMKEMYQCDTDTLIEETRKGNMGRETFQYADFMFCSHNGEVSNEHMITLRKFNVPCHDNILINIDKDYNFKSRFNTPAIGTMVTWLGTSGNSIENLLSFSYAQNTTEAKTDEPVDTGNENGGILGKMSAMMDKKRASMALQGGPSAFSSSKIDGAFGSDWGKREGGSERRSKVSDFHASKNANAIWRNNRIVKPLKFEGTGVKYQHTMTVTFEYDLMSFGGVNGRQAFLDLMANILITTSNECSFYGNAYRTTGVEPNELINQLYKGISGSKSFGENLSTLGNNVYNQLKSLASGDIVKAAKTILNNLGNSILGSLMNKLGRNAFLGMNSNFSDSPLGNWHLTIGNPRHPIATIGNLWLEDAKLEFSGPLNIDGFPSHVKVTCQLSECAQRDAIRIERIFSDGVGRVYHHASKEALVDMYTRQGKQITKVSVSDKKRNNDTNQAEYNHTIDSREDASQPTNTTIAKSQQTTETGICDLGCIGADKPCMPDLT